MPLGSITDSCIYFRHWIQNQRTRTSCSRAATTWGTWYHQTSQPRPNVAACQFQLTCSKLVTNTWTLCFKIRRKYLFRPQNSFHKGLQDEVFEETHRLMHPKLKPPSLAIMVERAQLLKGPITTLENRHFLLLIPDVLWDLDQSWHQGSINILSWLTGPAGRRWLRSSLF
jgi:hypothetical protein